MKEANKYISNFLQAYGIDISKYNDSFLNKTLQNRMNETYCDSKEAYCDFMEQNEMEVEKFLASLHISYSEFFRNPLTFSILEHVVLPAIISKKTSPPQKKIRIWSAACAAGHEAYSLAMLLEELKVNKGNKINYQIFATDQSKSEIDEALKGKFSADTLSNVNLKRVNQWFTIQNDSYTINKDLKKNIDFSVFDLFSEEFSCPPASIFGDFDLIICANLLFYYQPKYQKIIIEKIGSCLANGGYIVTGETERDVLKRQNYREVFPQSGIFQK